MCIPMKYMTYMGTKIKMSILSAFMIGLLVCGCAAAEASPANAEQSLQVVKGSSASPAVMHRTEEISLEGVEKSGLSDEDNQIEEAPAEKERPKVKGIFVTGAMVGTENMNNLIDLVERTELNAIVIDVKNDEGRVTYDMPVSLVQELGACREYISDMEALVNECKEKDIYLIARVVTFKDPFLAEKKPEWCVHNADGSLFKDKDGLAWLNPYNQKVWDYLVEIAESALAIGFDEVQFDYVRFSTDSGMKNADFGMDSQEKDRQQIITEFVQYASERIHAVGGAVSADVYGVVIDSATDQEIVGQDYVELSKYLDYISPMVYPSHYGPYNYNIPIPDAEPYRLVLAAMQSSRRVLAGIPASGESVSENTISGNTVSEMERVQGDSILQEKEEYSDEELASLPPMEGIKVQVRPWLQDFTATWVKGHIPYGGEEVRAQIQAVYDAGYEEWILWNAANRYTEEGLLTAGEIE